MIGNPQVVSESIHLHPKRSRPYKECFARGVSYKGHCSKHILF